MSVESTGTGVNDSPSFKEISTADFDESMNSLKRVIDSQFFEVKSDSNRIIFEDILSVDTLNEKAKQVLSESNYEINALNGEHIILFSTPLFISELTCSGRSSSIADDKSNMVRLIAGKVSEKKFISQKPSINSALSVYKINDTVNGFVLPQRTTLAKFKAIDFHRFFADEKKLNYITDAHKKVSYETACLNQAVFNQADVIKNYLDVKGSEHKAFIKDINTTLKEKERLEQSCAQNSEILERIQEDIKKETVGLESVEARRADTYERFQELKQSIDDNKEKMQSEKAEMNVVSNEVMDKKNKLADLHDQIKNAQKDINITTLDMRGFSSESKKQLSYYFWLAISAIAFLGVVFYHMYDNAKTFIELIDTNPSVAPLDILLSRLPIITATTLVIGTLSALLFYLVNHIISINVDKMNMLKASILAEQITASLPSKDMTEEEIRDHKRNTKIELVMNVFNIKPEKFKDGNHKESLQYILDALKLGK
jgi:hypothetical protein